MVPWSTAPQWRRLGYCFPRQTETETASRSGGASGDAADLNVQQARLCCPRPLLLPATGLHDRDGWRQREEGCRLRGAREGEREREGEQANPWPLMSVACQTNTKLEERKDRGKKRGEKEKAQFGNSETVFSGHGKGAFIFIARQVADDGGEGGGSSEQTNGRTNVVVVGGGRPSY